MFTSLHYPLGHDAAMTCLTDDYEVARCLINSHALSFYNVLMLICKTADKIQRPCNVYLFFSRPAMYNMMKMLCACSCVALQQLTAVWQVPVWQTDCHGPRLLVGVMNTHTWMATHQVCVMLIALSRPNVSTATELTHSTLIQSGITQVEYLRGMASHSEGLAD